MKLEFHVHCAGCDGSHFVATSIEYNAAKVRDPIRKKNGHVFMCPECLVSGIDKLPVTEWKGYSECGSKEDSKDSLLEN
jgi:hypothetical protein